MYVHVRFAQMYRGYLDINLFHEWLRFFLYFYECEAKVKIWQKSCLACEINSIFSIENIEFCVYYIFFDFWTFRHCMHYVYLIWSHNPLLFIQCANNSLWRYIFYSMKKTCYCKNMDICYIWQSFKNVHWFTGFGISCKGSEILWN